MTAEVDAAEFRPAKSLQEFVARIAERRLRVGIVGLGYVGLPLALLFAEDGFRITGLDVDAAKVDALNRGESYIQRIEPEHIRAARVAGFVATTDFAAVRALDAVLICVPTPLHADHTPDMSYVVATMEALAPHVRAGQLVVLESTTYPGTTEEIVVATLEQAGQRVMRAPAGIVAAAGETQIPFGNDNKRNDNQRRAVPAANVGYGESALHDEPLQDVRLDGVMVAFSPEREDPGNTVTPRREIPKIVGGVGGREGAASVAACALYGVVFRRAIAMSSPATAEMTKLLENIYRAVNIALVNQMKLTAMGMGIDIWEVIEAAATKPFGFQAFAPGPGVGGHCIPVDPFYLTWKARQFGLETPFIELAGQTNEAMPAYVVETIRRALLEREGKALAGAKVLVLGVAYKRDVDDLRESPALTVIGLLQAAGAEVRYNDPYFPFVGSGRKYRLEMRSTPLEDLAEYNCVAILTDHSAYDYGAIVDEARLVVDTRNATRGVGKAKVVRC